MLNEITQEALKNASFQQLNVLCEEIREKILQTVSKCGGHLSSNLGSVELTVALHRVFSFPQDKIVFDVGHQCYTHKLLSDRKEQFFTIRQRGGLSGFPKRSESLYDCYDTGHAGTALSAALGIAKARDLKNEKFSVIAFIGDGSFHNGLIYEALNSLKILNTNVLIILNDNDMSISPTVGGTHDIFTQIKRSSGEAGDQIKLFEQYGLQYAGVFNGNDVEESVQALIRAKELMSRGSVLLHAITKKGNGFAFCENAPERTHGVSPKKTQKNRIEYSTVLGEELTELAKKYENIVSVTAAMTDSLGLRNFFNAFPERSFDVGICEEHAAVLCAALATQGMKPYYAIYSTFLQRAFDEVIHDVCGQDLPVTFCIDRAGITGADGETHQGVFDLSYLSFIPNLTIAIPKNVAEFRAMLRASVTFNHPLAIRYPREGGNVSDELSIEIGKFDILHSNTSNIVLYAAGEKCVDLAMKLLARANEEGFSFSIVNARFLKPLDVETLQQFDTKKYIVTLEDNVLCGGLGDAINRYYLNSTHEIANFGYGDRFIPHGEIDELSKEYGLNEDKIYLWLKERYARG